jgi:hypothetical protein
VAASKIPQGQRKWGESGISFEKAFWHFLISLSKNLGPKI